MTILIQPVLASGALQFAFEKATPEGKMTITVLFLLSMFSWTIMITKFRQLWIARKESKKFFAAYTATRDPLDIQKRGDEFDGAPAYQLYARGAEEVAYHLKNNPVHVTATAVHGKGDGNTDILARENTTKVGSGSFEAVKVVLEEAAVAQAMALEKGMIVLSTAVAGGPFIGLLGTVWGVMETFAGIAKAGQASLTAMARGGRVDRDGRGSARRHPGDVRLQLHGDDHPQSHAGTGRLCGALCQPDRTHLRGQPGHRGQTRRGVEAP